MYEFYLIWAWVFGLVVGGLALGLVGVPRDLAEASPWAVLVRDRKVALVFMLAGALLFGVGVGLAVGLAFGLRNGLAFGLGAWLVSWCGAIMDKAAWPSYMVARGWLALRRRLPWSLMSFLADAHQRGVMRQAGAVYQFRHIELQHRLASRYANGQRGDPASAAPAAATGK